MGTTALTIYHVGATPLHGIFKQVTFDKTKESEAKQFMMTHQVRL